MHHPTVARKLSESLRDYLLQHLRAGEPVPIPITRSRYAHRGNTNHQTIRTLERAGLIRYDKPLHPRETLITEDGRAVACCLLGMYADALVQATGATIRPPENLAWRQAVAKVAARYAREAPLVPETAPDKAENA